MQSGHGSALVFVRPARRVTGRVLGQFTRSGCPGGVERVDSAAMTNFITLTGLRQ